MAAPVVFDPALFKLRFPEFAALTDEQCSYYFELATVIQRNDGTSPITDDTMGLNLLYLLTAHMATVYGQGRGGMVGRITGASEGSVSVQTDYGSVTSQQQAFLLQSSYGATWWALTAQYRTFRYIQGALQPGGLGYAGASNYGRYPGRRY